MRMATGHGLPDLPAWCAVSAPVVAMTVVARRRMRTFQPPRSLRLEAVAHGDIVLLNAPAALQRIAGPVRSTMLWFACAIRTWPRARLVGHAEDDVYVHLAGAARHLRVSLEQLPAPSSGSLPLMYWGHFKCFHWSRRLHAAAPGMLPDRTMSNPARSPDTRPRH